MVLAQQTTRFTTHPSSIGCNEPSISSISSICTNGTHGARMDVGQKWWKENKVAKAKNRAYFSATGAGQSELQGRTIKSRVRGKRSLSSVAPARRFRQIPIMPSKVVETPYPLIDADPHASRVIRYFRPSDYASWAGATAAFPAALYVWGVLLSQLCRRSSF